MCHIHGHAHTYRDEGGSLSSSRIIEVLSAVGCKGAADDKIQILAQLRILLKSSPVMCEQFFQPHPPLDDQKEIFYYESCIENAEPQLGSPIIVTAWSTAVRLIDRCDIADVAAATSIIEHLLAILVVVAQQVGIGVEKLRQLLSMTIHRGRWAPYSFAILDAVNMMVLGDNAVPAPIPFSPNTGTRTPGAGSIAGLGAEQRGAGASMHVEGSGKTFVFDGQQGGLFLGRFEAWPFDCGYAFETFFWAEESVQESGRYEKGRGRCPLRTSFPACLCLCVSGNGALCRGHGYLMDRLQNPLEPIPTPFLHPHVASSHSPHRVFL